MALCRHCCKPHAIIGKACEELGPFSTEIYPNIPANLNVKVRINLRLVKQALLYWCYDNNDLGHIIAGMSNTPTNAQATPTNVI